MELLEVAAVVISLLLLWSGLRRLEFDSLLGTALTFLDLLLLGLTVWKIGWWGVVAVLIVNVFAIAVWSVILAARVESKLVAAGIQIEESKEAMKALYDRLGRLKELKAVGPVDRAELIRLLAERHRTPSEVETMATPIIMLKTMHNVPLDWLVERFDRLLRLSGEPVGKAMEVAATIHATATQSATTFSDIVDGLISFYAGETEGLDPAHITAGS